MSMENCKGEVGPIKGLLPFFEFSCLDRPQLESVVLTLSRYLSNRTINMLRLPVAGLTGICLACAGAEAAQTLDLPSFEIRIVYELSEDRTLADYYGERGFKPIWTGQKQADQSRLAALFGALEAAASHGLPFGDIEAEELRSLLRSATDLTGIAKAEVRATQLYLQVASALSAGIIDPKSVHSGISRKRPIRSDKVLLDGILNGDAAEFISGLPPSTGNYVGLRKKHRELDSIIASGGWGEPVEARLVAHESSGLPVVRLRNRLIRMGYLSNTATTEYDDALMFAVKRFQADHGLDPDGIADRRTIRAVNVTPEVRRQQVIAALERARWMNFPLGEQYVLVNLPDYNAAIIRDGKPVFETRVVVGQADRNWQTPEFSDKMTHMIINPTWWVPRSISTKEILPKLWEDPMAEPQLVIFDPETGRTINRQVVDFKQFNGRSFPFEMRQPPGPGNALGQVKFMFPNRFNVYMHDTPLRALFLQEYRSLSHGCIRVHRPRELAEFLLGMQFDEPGEVFRAVREYGRESRINLETHLPVHITYQTAWVSADGNAQFRNDIYGRDSLIYQRLAGAGLDLNFPTN